MLAYLNEHNLLTLYFVLSIVFAFVINTVPILIYRFKIYGLPCTPEDAKKIAKIYGVAVFFALTILGSLSNLGVASGGSVFFWGPINYCILKSGNEPKPQLKSDKPSQAINKNLAKIKHTSERPKIKTPETANVEDFFVTLFNTTHNEILSRVQNSKLVHNANVELVPFIYAIADMSAHKNKSLRESVNKALSVYVKGRYISDDFLKKRINLYASAIRGEIFLRGVWICGAREKWESNWIMFCSAILGDLLICPVLGNDYVSGKREYFGVEDLVEYTDQVIKQILACAMCINDQINQQMSKTL